jgi:hypothetical protein
MASAAGKAVQLLCITRIPVHIQHLQSGSEPLKLIEKITRHCSGFVRYWIVQNESLANVPVITRFVREVLGCDCPDEVFRHVEVRRGSTVVKSIPVDYELRIGGRLLVVVTSESVDILSGSRLEAVILEGKQARDDGKFNRFRLVVQARNVAEDKEKLSRSFEAVSGKDEKTHVHVVEMSEVPDFYSR